MLRQALVAGIAAAVMAGCGGDDPVSQRARAPDGAPGERADSATINEVAGTYRGIGIGSRRVEAIRRFGRMQSGPHDPLEPIGEHGLAIGLPPTPSTPAGVDAIAVWRFRDVALAADPRRAWLIIVSARDALTPRGVGVGSTLDAVRAAYPGSRCGTANEGTEYVQFPYCTARIRRGRHIWFAYDPVRSVTLSRAPLTRRDS